MSNFLDNNFIEYIFAYLKIFYFLSIFKEFTKNFCTLLSIMLYNISRFI